MCAADPQFTLVFDVHIIATFTSNDPVSIALPFTDGHVGTVTMDLVVAGDQSDAVRNAVNSWGLELGTVAAGNALAGNEIIALGDLIKATGQLLAHLGGIGYAAACEANQHLPDRVSANLSLLSSSTVGSAAIAVDQPFSALFQQLLSAFSVGFNRFDVVAGSDGSLIFRWTAPPGTKATLFSLDTQANAQPTLVPPMIGADQTQIVPGTKLTVHGYYFKGAYTTHLRIGWNDTVPGQPKTANVDWQQQGGPIQHATTSQGSFEAVGLTPGTTYQFRVRDCTPITCTQMSDWFSTATQAQGSDQVVLSLDDSTHTIGNAILTGDGTFSASVTIPQGTVPGQHTVYAKVAGQSTATSNGGFARAVNLPQGIDSGRQPSSSAVPLATVAPISGGSSSSSSGAVPARTTTIIGNVVEIAPGGGQQAKLPILVCSSGGCKPAIAPVDPYTNTPYSGGGGVFVATESFTLKGQDFAPHQGVTLYLDGPNGQTIGTTNVGADGSFLAKFTMSNSTGQHSLVAIQAVNGQMLQANYSVFVQQLPR